MSVDKENNDSIENQDSVDKPNGLNIHSSYAYEPSFKLSEYLGLIDEQKAHIDDFRPLNDNLWQTIQEKLKVEWIHNSNAIEGSTLTMAETIFFLKEGLTVEGKPFKDFLDARNHSEAINYLMDVLKDTRPITEGLLKEVNALLLNGVTHTKAINQFDQIVNKPATPGEYKANPNHVLQPDGSIHKYVDPLQVTGQMSVLVNWVNEHIDKKHPLIVAALAHYNMVRIHPFDDGNGRGARILMNLILMKKGFPPAIVENEQRRKYIESLTAADKGSMDEFVEFIGLSLQKTQEMMLEDLNTNK